MIEDRILSTLESLLFLSGEPLTYVRLAKTLDISEQEVEEAVLMLEKECRESSVRGLMVVRDENTVVLATKPSNASALESLIKGAREEGMSKAALEVLAIIAYRAPVSRAEIDAIRGVNCSFTLRNLLLRDLIEREGNPSDSRGYLYRPTLKFLETLGLSTVSELPQFETLSQDERLQMVLEETVSTEEDAEKKIEPKEE